MTDVRGFAETRGHLEPSRGVCCFCNDAGVAEEARGANSARYAKWR